MGMRYRLLTLLSATVASMGLGGCDQLGIETPQKAGERLEADAKAIGSACRHAMRAIEDCYVLNPKAERSSVFVGWREMDEYMRENKLEGVAPVVPRLPAPAAAASKASEPEEDEEDVVEESQQSAKKNVRPAAKLEKSVDH